MSNLSLDQRPQGWDAVTPGYEKAFESYAGLFAKEMLAQLRLGRPCIPVNIPNVSIHICFERDCVAKLGQCAISPQKWAISESKWSVS
jgi:hypothetical protein